MLPRCQASCCLYAALVIVWVSYPRMAILRHTPLPGVCTTLHSWLLHGLLLHVVTIHGQCVSG